MDETLEAARFVFLCLIAVALILEVSVLIAAFATADKITCNYLWCTFTTEKTTGTTHQETIITRDCYINGERTNCSEMQNATILH